MKLVKTLVIASFLSLYSFSSIAVVWNVCDVSMFKRDGLCYKKFSNEPYDGKLESFNRDGTLDRRYIYKNGIAMSYEQYLPWGALEVGFKRSKEDLEIVFHEIYHLNGLLSMKFTDYKGQPVGRHVSYHQNGELRIRGYWHEGEKRGEPKGVWETYDEKGNVTCRHTHDDNGKIIKEERFIDEGNC